MKIKKCKCGCDAFLAYPIDGTYRVMCKDGGNYNHRFGPVKKRRRAAIRAWNKEKRA